VSKHLSQRDMDTLADALRTVRDAWVLISLQLKDQIANQPSPARDEVLVQVERHLARMREGEIRPLDMPPKDPP